MTCTHKRGDTFQGMWICGDCFEMLHARPVKYGMVPGMNDRAERQNIIWKAEIAKDESGTTLGKFLTWMVGYLRLRSLWTISKDEARKQCLEVLSDMGEPFGTDGACWERCDAKDLIREGICAYWDEGGSASSNTI